PSERVESPKRWRTLPAVLTVAEIDKLLQAPNTDAPLAIRDRALLEFAYATGVRVSELVALKLQDILFEDGVARVFGKGAKERLVPVGRRALGAVALYARQIRPTLDRGHGRGVLFLNARGAPGSPSASRRIRCGTPSRRISWREARTCARSKRCWVTWTSPPHSSTRT